MVLSTVVLSTRGRRLISEWTGGDRVVLKLAEVPFLARTAEDPPGAADAADGVREGEVSASSDRSESRFTWNYTDRTGYTESICSTFLEEEDRINDPLAPLNALDAHPDHRSY